MYLNKKQIKALEIALEAMESYPFASYDAEQNDAMNTIISMLNSARNEVSQRYRKRERTKLEAQH